MKEYILGTSAKNFLKDPDGVVCYTHTFEKGKVYKEGEIYPSNDNNAIGIVYNEVDATNNDTIGALMVEGRVLEKALQQTINANAKKVLMQRGIHFYNDNGEELVTPAV